MNAAKTTVCNVRVANLRQAGYTDIEQWLANPENVYVGRYMRIFVHSKPDEKGATTSTGKKIVHLKESRFCNRFKGVPLEESLRLFRADLLHRLATEPDLKSELIKLKGKRLGCWCAPQPCHADIVAELANNDAHASQV
jgi:hypothetical protein